MKKIVLSLCLSFFALAAMAQQYSCPYVNAGPDVALPCGSNCTTLNASFLPSGTTASYTGSAITYAPYPYLNGVAPPFPFYTSDDSYSGLINLPFPFCFFGNVYNQCVIGNNGMISFDLSYAGGPNPWSLAGAPTIPSPSQQLNSIMGPYMDIYPFLLSIPDSNYINYATIGTAPCRKFVVSYYHVPYYNGGLCGGILLTSQIVLYETTNVIEIYIGNKPICNAWNSGLAIEGIQNATGTLGYAVPGRNNTAWSASSDGYRFTPSGPSNVTVNWYDGSTGANLATGSSSVLVCPPNNRSTPYVATATYLNCNNVATVVTDTVQVNVLQSAGPTQYLSCPSPTASATMNASGTGTWVAIPTNPSPTTIANPTSPTTVITGFSAAGTYMFQWSAGLCVDTEHVIVTQRANAGPDQNICKNDSAVMNAYGTGTWSAMIGNPATTVITSPTQNNTSIKGFTAGGAYSFIWTTSPGCSDTVVINVPFFAISVTAASTTVCQYANTTVTVTPSPANLGPFQYQWLNPNTVQSPTSATTLVNAVPGNTYYPVQVTSNDGCKLTDSVLISTSALIGTNISAGANPTTVCPGSPTLLTVVANPNSCGPAATPCTAPGTTVVLGTATTVQNGTGFAYPSPYGNYYKSAHHQFLIHASEILSQVSAGGQIKSLMMDVGTLNGGSSLQNFTIKLACVGADSLPNSFLALGSLTTVYSVATYTITTGWNTHVFTTPYDWDGVSNLIVDVCFSSATSGSANPKMVYTTTPYKSVWCTFGNDPGGQCNIIGIQSVPVANNLLFQRPNMKLNMCITDLTGANLLWTPSTGPNAPVPDNLDSVIAHPIAPTTYQVALTSANGCVNYDFVTVNVDTTTKLTLTKDTFVCSVQPIQLNAVVSGSAVNPAQVTYTWTASTGAAPPSGTGPSFANPVVTPTTTTLYTVTTSGGGGCSLFDSIRVTTGNGLPVNKTVDSITCAGANNGQININMNAGVAPFHYVWTPAVAGNVSSATNLGPGMYTLSVTDAQGCSGKDTTILTAPSPLALILDSTNDPCFGNTTGTVTAVVTGGRAPYRYTWSPAATNTNGLTGLPAGLYLLTLTDTSGCTISGQVNVTQPAQLSSSAVTTNLSGAGTHDGTITMTTSGGTPGYTYTSVPPVSGLPNATGLDTGEYSITTCDAHNCCVTTTAHISGPPPILVVPTIVNNLCNGQCNGSISVTASGGVAPYGFVWNTTPVNNTNAVSNLCAGNYTVTVTDANGITVANTYIITAPTALADKIDSTLITCFGANNGALNDSAYGGTPPYTIAWTPGGSNPLSNLGPGTYSVSITDANGCPLTDGASLGEPTQVTATITSTDSVKCFGQSNGVARVLAAGGRPPYSYQWSGSTSVVDSATDLAAGPQTVTVTDASGCTGTAAFSINQPLQILANVIPSPAHCAASNDGSAAAAASNGTAPYTYTWDGTVGNSTITGLSAGAHTLLVTDANGCSTQQAFNIDTLYVLHISLVADSVTCYGGNDGQVTVTVANGNPNFTYQWSPSGAATNPATELAAGMQIVTVTDNFQCAAVDSTPVYQPAEINIFPTFINPLCFGDHNGKIWLTASGGNGGPYKYTYQGTQYQMTDTVTGLASGTYLFVVNDYKGCVGNASVTLVDPPQLQVSTVVTAITCANSKDGIITANVLGGTPAYTYAWTPVATNNNVDANLAPGTYTVLVTDANGCTQSSTQVLTAPPPISFTYIRSDSTSCPYSSDGHIVVNVTGGTPGTVEPYTYAINGQTAQADSNFYNLTGGVYQIVVTDSQHCQLSTSVSVYSPLAINIAVNPTDTLLQLGSSITLSTVLSNYTTQTINSYIWSPSAGLSCIDCPAPIATPYQRQDYTVVINYGKNCTASANATVRVDHGPDTYIPNAFSPNGDGTNDVFTVFGTSLKSVAMKVFNRWGEKVFDSGDSQWAAWDGTYRGVLQPTGVYVYAVELTYLDGKKETREGSLTMIR